MPDNLSLISNAANEMVRAGLNSFVNLDANAARKVLHDDDNVDRLNLQIIIQLQRVMQQQPQLIVPALHCFSATRHLERIGDHATNIAEDVIYLVEGDIVRHQHDQETPT